jgi:hypothetical protein
MRIRTVMHALLVLVILLVGGKIIAAWRRPAPAVSGDAEAPPSPAPDGGGVPASLTPEASNALVMTIAQNDLFSPDRGAAPPPPPEKAPETVPPPSHLKLVGVVLTRSRAEAFLSDSSQGNKVVRVKQGDSIGQYQLLQVGKSEVKLSLGAGGGVAPLRLNILDSATSQQAPRLIPNVAPPQVGSGRPGPGAGRFAVPPNADPNQEAAAPAPAPEEAQALRENIQRMQQRLRRIRRRAAREEAAARGENLEAENEDEEEDEEE